MSRKSVARRRSVPRTPPPPLPPPAAPSITPGMMLTAIETIARSTSARADGFATQLGELSNRLGARYADLMARVAKLEAEVACLRNATPAARHECPWCDLGDCPTHGDG